MMNVYIPIADVTLTDGQTYDRQLPLWATRPLMVKVTTGTNEPVNITVRNSGSPVKTVTLPYQQYGVDIDLSFAAPLLKRADRNKSQGTPWFMQQELLFWVDDPMDYITIPVFHCDLTYWDTLGVDAALPQPIKPRIPGQTLDIFFPYIIHPSDALSVQVEPVTGAPSNAIFPTTYVLGDTIDITYIKKLTIKNVWGNGLDQVINYEDRLMSDVVYDEGLQCALRARWNMRNGQWFWAAFKDYFWSNKFTAIRGRGGVTEQAELTINLEYGEEWYNVYQELLVSSNVVFELNIPGINQYQSKRFRAEVTGDTGTRWSNSTKTYRQQVRFRTTELQDNYMFPQQPQQPDQPPTPSIAFSAQKHPWMIDAAYAEGLTNSIYSNAAWEVQSTPAWMSVGNINGNAGTSNLTATVAANTGEVRTGNIVLKSKMGAATYTIPIVQAGTTGNITAAPSSFDVGYVTLPVATTVLSYGDWFIDYIPAEVTASVQGGGGGNTNVTFTVADNTTSSLRTLVITLKNVLTSNLFYIVIRQDEKSTSISIEPTKVTAPKTSGTVRYVACGSINDWTMLEKPSWVAVAPYSGAAGLEQIDITYTANNTGTKRSGYLKVKNTVTNEIGICIIEQGG